MGSTARLYGSITLGLALLGCAIVLYCEEAHLSVTVRLTSGFSSPPADRYLAQFQSARLCKRFSLPSEYFNDTSGPYNPAAARNPKTGEWLLLFTYDEVWFGLSNYSRHGTYLEGRMRSHPLLAKLGNEAVPSTAIQGTVSMLGLDGAYEQKAKSEGSDLYKAADWRPFAFKEKVFLGHWIGYLPAQERMALSVLNLESGKTELVHRFSTLSKEIEDSALPKEAPAAKISLRRSLLPMQHSASRQANFRREKNWGFMEEDGVILITYALLPCTVVLELDLANPEALRIRSRHCYMPQAPSILQATGLDITRTHVHMSGNPVPYDIKNGELHQEYIVMLHTKSPEYINWAVRMDRKTKHITHISAGPILRSQDYRNEGFLQTALVVSSFHVLPKDKQTSDPSDTFLRIYYGEGDKFGCWLNMDVRQIVWQKLDASLASAK